MTQQKYPSIKFHFISEFEPEVKEKDYSHSTKDYAQFFFLFLLVVSCFVCVFFFGGGVAKSVSTSFNSIINNMALSGLIAGTLRLAVAFGVTGLFTYSIGKLNIVNTGMIEESYVAPVKNFFNRYGTY